jgi:hypothetical protein
MEDLNSFFNMTKIDYFDCLSIINSEFPLMRLVTIFASPPGFPTPCCGGEFCHKQSMTL